MGPPREGTDEKESIPTVVKLIDRASVIDAFVQTERAHWGEITARNLASLNPDLGKSDLENIRQSEDRFGEERATMVRLELGEAISETKSTLASRRLTALRNHRDKYLAHSLAATNREKKSGPVPPPKYDYAIELFDISMPIVEKLYRCITGSGFEIAQSQKISRECAEALWKGCKFTVAR